MNQDVIETALQKRVQRRMTELARTLSDNTRISPSYENPLAYDDKVEEARKVLLESMRKSIRNEEADKLYKKVFGFLMED
jgi:hypothetical protein